MSDTPPDERSAETPGHSHRTRYAYLRRDGTLDIVLGSLVAGVGAYIYQFLGGRSLGEEAFAPIAALLTAHFLAFVIILLPIEQFVIRRITLGYRGWVVPARAVALAVSTGAVAAAVVWSLDASYFDGEISFVWFVIATVAFHFFFVVGRGYLAGYRRFRAYGYVSGAASILRLVIAVVVVIIGPTVTGFAWAQVLGPLVIFFWRPWRTPDERRTGSRGELEDEHVEQVGEKGLLSGLVLSSAASQALLLAGPLVAGALGATAAQFSITYATLVLARAPLTLGYNLIARVLPTFTEMAARGERRELRSWARGMGIAGVALAFVGAGIGAVLGPPMVAVAFGDGFRPSATVAALAAAGVVLASAGLFVGQILVARGRAVRLAVAWFIAVAAAVVAVLIPISDPVVHEDGDRYYWNGLYGINGMKMEDLVEFGRSWAYAPTLEIATKGYTSLGYDRSERCYQIENSNPKAKKCEITLSGNEDSPINNPAFFIKSWNAETAQVLVNGKPAKDVRIGINHELEGSNLVLFLFLESNKSVNITILP